MKRILIPVDGQDKSEEILPVAAAVARDSGGVVRLLRVYPIPEPVIGAYGKTVAYADQEMARFTAMREDDMARILAEAEAFEADLIALAGAPRGRLGAALAPGVAERVARESAVPTLLLKIPA